MQRPTAATMTEPSPTNGLELKGGAKSAHHDEKPNPARKRNSQKVFRAMNLFRSSVDMAVVTVTMR
jgi:hypothetical protein